MEVFWIVWVGGGGPGVVAGESWTSTRRRGGAEIARRFFRFLEDEFELKAEFGEEAEIPSWIRVPQGFVTVMLATFFKV
jgi:hypothetical protein